MISRISKRRHLLRVVFAVDLSRFVGGQDVVVGEVDQEEVQRLGRILERLVLVVSLLDDPHPGTEFNSTLA